MAKILLVDDEPSILTVLGTLLKAEDHEVTPALGGDKALELIKSTKFDLMLCDIRMTPVDGMEILRQARQAQPLMAVIMLTAYGSVETAIGAMKFGAFDYITKPFKVDELMITVQRALDYNRAVSENESLKARLQTQYRLENLVAESAPMQAVCEMIKKVAPTDATVLIYGESGTGKELVARAIHACSRRHDRNFLPVNCAALPEPLLESEMFGHVKGAFTGATANKTGLFEAAGGGTIFLDEVGAMPPSIQAKLLRVLQDKQIRPVGSNESIPVDARVLAATNNRLETLMKAGTFREDLYYRLSVIPIEIKPLRERREDILPLLFHFLRKETPQGAEPPSIDPETRAMFESYSWPGNVRELENAVKHAVALARGGKITKECLPPRMITAMPQQSQAPTSSADAAEFKGKSLRTFLRAKEREYLQQVLSTVGGDKEEAAKALKISLATLYRKLPEKQD
jgi:DNA-binding NtrC family response regulator